MDKQGEATTQRESTPQAPEKTGRAGESPGASDKNPPPNGMPRGGLASKAPPQESPGAQPPALPTEVVPRGPDAKDRWGDLPVHARDVFRAQGGGDMPARYREWIDAYYKRLNKSP